MNYKKYLRNIIPIILGALSGFLYYNFIGCYSGNCAITSNPLISILYGAIIGFVFIDFKHKRKEGKSDEN
jgi:hypothetical protein